MTLGERSFRLSKARQVMSKEQALVLRGVLHGWRGMDEVTLIAPAGLRALIMRDGPQHPRDFVVQLEMLRALSLRLAADLATVCTDYVVESDSVYREAFDEVDSMMKSFVKLQKRFESVSKEEFDALEPIERQKDQ